MPVNAVIELHYCAQALSHSRAGMDKTGDMVKRAGFLRSRQHNYGGGQINASQDLGQLFAIDDFYFQSEIFPNRAHDAVRAENNNNRIDLQLLKAFRANPSVLAPIMAEIAKLMDPAALPAPERAAVIKILRDVLDVKRVSEASAGVSKLSPVATLIARMSQALVKNAVVLKKLPAITKFAAAIVMTSAKTMALPAVMASARIFVQIAEGIRADLPVPALRAILHPAVAAQSLNTQNVVKPVDIKLQPASKAQAVKTESIPVAGKATPVAKIIVKSVPALQPTPKPGIAAAVKATSKHVPIKTVVAHAPAPRPSTAPAPRTVNAPQVQNASIKVAPAPIPLPASRVIPVANASHALPSVSRTADGPSVTASVTVAPVTNASKAAVQAPSVFPAYVPASTPVAIAVSVQPVAVTAAVIAKSAPNLKSVATTQKDTQVTVARQDILKADPVKAEQPKHERAGLCSNFCACAQHGGAAPVIQTQADVTRVLGGDVAKRVSVEDAKAFIRSDVQAAQIIQTQKIESISTAGEHMKADLLKTMAKMEAAQKDGKPFQHIHGRFCGCAAHAMPVTPVADSITKTKAVASARKADTKSIKTMTFEP